MLRNFNTNVIIVDDDQEFLEEVDEMLTLSGYKVEVASNGEDAIMRVLISRPAIMLLDMKMSPKSGFQIADDLINSLCIKDLVIIGMTGFFKEKEHRKIMNMCGIRRCIIKPIQPLDLIAKIEFAMEERRSALRVMA